MRQVPRNRGAEGDELIISGDGAGCWDDEDCSAYSTDPAASDDLITPRIVMVSARPPYNPVQQGFRTSTTRPPASTCSDDEDCVEGSGDGSDDDEDDDDRSGGRRFVSTTLRPPHPASPSISYSWPGLRTAAPTPYYARPAPPTPFEDKSIMFTSKPIPPDPVISETVYERPRPTPPPRPTGPRVIIDVPKPSIPHHHRDKDKTPPPVSPRHTPPPTISNSFNKSSADKTALVIGVIAVIIIVIVIVAPFVVYVRVRYRPAVPKSIDNRNNYQFNSVSGTPQILLPNPAAGSVSHLTGVGPPVPGDFKQAPQLPQKKDLKEWYV